MRITAATFPTPDLIKKSNNPAIWDQQARFAEFQAAAANEAVDRLGSRLGTASSPFERSAVFVQLYRDLAEWRYQLAHRAEGQSPNADLEQYHAAIGDMSMVDTFGPGLRSVGSRMDPSTATLTTGETEYQRGGDATIRVPLAASHTRVFGAAPRLPQDIDVMAYVAGQSAFHEHVERSQTILPADGSAPSGQGPAAARVQPRRTTGLERG